MPNPDADITGGTVEEEGIFGFSFGLVAATTNFTVEFASAVTSAALDAVSEATCNVGRLLTGAPASTDLCITRVGSQSKEFEDPILMKVTTSVSHMILDTVFPVLTSPSVLMRLLTYEPKSQIPLLTSSSSDMTFFTAKSHESANSESWDDYDVDTDIQMNPVEESKTGSTRTNRTSSLSTLSDSSGATSSEESEDDGYDEFLKLMEQDNGSRSELETKSQSPEQHEATPAEPSSPSYYLDFSALLEGEEANEDLNKLPLTKDDKDDVFFVLQSSPQHVPPMKCMLEMLINKALHLAKDDSANTDNKCPVWKPEGDTKKTLQRMHKLSLDERTNELSKAVLKWTGVLKNNKDELRLIKTRGIVKMSPRELKDLLIDCSRGHLVNKNSLGKRDVCKFPCDVGTTTIVENTMKIPFVGGEIHSVVMTHSRFVESHPIIGDNFYVLVSKSVQKELNQSTGLPSTSISVLRQVGDDPCMTDLVNVAQISEVPVPKFLINKIAFTGAVDFFTNIRSI